eukprot:COSAG03_NODE_8585_length_791_cov_0.786127_1_plen_150_part_10
MVDAAHLPALAVGAALGGIVSQLCCAPVATARRAEAVPAADASDGLPVDIPSPTPQASPAPGRPLRISSTQEGESNGTEVLVIGVCGGSGSGKSTVAEKLVSGIGDHQLAYLSHDWYYRDQSHITRSLSPPPPSLPPSLPRSLPLTLLHT